MEPAHRGYAAAWVAQQRRSFVASGPLVAVVWGQVMLTAGRGDAPVWLRFMFAAAVVFTVIVASSAVLQLRRERAVRPYLSDPRRS